MRWFLKLLAGAALATALAQIIFFPRWTVDDAYIAYRYGLNWAEAGELTWNVGETPVEGYTGIALPAIAALCFKTGIPVVAAVRYLGILCWVITGFLIWHFLRKNGVRSPVPEWALLIYSTAPFLFTHAVCGLETTLFMLVFTWFGSGIFHLFLNEKATFWRFLVAFLPGGLACLIRPEAMALVPALTLLLGVWKLKNESGFLLRLSGAFCTGFLIPALVYLIWRHAYYGEWLPNTWYAKLAGGMNPESIKAVVKFLLPEFGLLALLFGVSAVLAFRQLTGKKESRVVFFAVAAAAAVWLVLAAGYAGTHLYMNFSHRFFAPFVPISLIAWAFAMHVVWNHLVHSKEYKLLKINALVVFISIVTCYFAVYRTVRLRYEVQMALHFRAIMEDEWFKVAGALKETVPAGGTVLCFVDAGVIPFASGLRAIDFGMLNDHYLAHQKPGFGERADYFFSHQAEAAVFTSFRPDSCIYTDEAAFIMNDSRFENYVLFEKFNNTTGYDYHQFLYLRKDIFAATQGR